MTKLNLPRYFVARSDYQPAFNRAEDFIPLYALDNFFAGGRHLQEQEWIVSTDAAGLLRATSGDQVGTLSEDIQSQIAFSEVACEGNIRLVETIDFYLFNIQLMEQAPGAPGLNDPIYLYGTLFGSYPAAGGSNAICVEGQLTVTRADLLEALVEGAKYRFKASGAGADVGSTTSIHHLVLPGDRDEETIRGAGIIFAYPLMPPDMMSYGAGNELLVSQYLFDILSGIKEDLEKENIKVPLRKMRLPVPNRLTVEQELEAQGYIIKGDTAVRKPNMTGGFQGFLQSVFGSGQQEKLTLPEQGSLEDFISLANQVMHSLPGWPPERTKIMRSKIQTASREVRMRAKGTAALKPREIKIPNQTDMQPARARGTAPSTTGSAAYSNQPPPWMQDFINKHKNNEQEGWSKLTQSNLQKGKAELTNNPYKGQTFSYTSSTSYAEFNNKRQKPTWMEDFSEAGDAKADKPVKPPPEEKKTGNPSDKTKKPDWMKDFE
ncbi:MAG: hypothetical protein IPK73_19690 [Candidatus Obscuribacter sp.]|nr:hypothetical protein [Candidatus Obscuribacter sp.]MBK9278143.1 hypothetical protein [Candidatus Obscuribacter sp.]